MVDLKALKKPTPKLAKAVVAADAAPPPKEAVSTAPAPVKNLHRAPRGRNAPKQFLLPPDVVVDFEIEARRQGFKRDSAFFLHVWETYKARR